MATHRRLTLTCLFCGLMILVLATGLGLALLVSITDDDYGDGRGNTASLAPIGGGDPLPRLPARPSMFR
jgi:hypothetical protein